MNVLKCFLFLHTHPHPQNKLMLWSICMHVSWVSAHSKESSALFIFFLITSCVHSANMLGALAADVCVKDVCGIVLLPFPGNFLSSCIIKTDNKCMDKKWKIKPFMNKNLMPFVQHERRSTASDFPPNSPQFCEWMSFYRNWDFSPLQRFYPQRKKLSRWFSW